MNVAPTEANILAALNSFLAAVLPGVEVVEGQDNRVAPPANSSYVVMWPPQYARLSTNVDGYGDVKFVGSIAGTVMTVTQAGSPPATFGVIEPGATVFGAGVAIATVVGEQLTGPTGGAGTYAVTPSQTVSAGTLSSGAKQAVQQAECTVQVDFHAADGTSGNMAQIVSTLLRDEYGTQQFADQDPNYGVSPLHADDPRQTPWPNDQQQIEWKWSLDVHLQAGQTVQVPQQFADSAEVTVVSVDATYPL